MEKWRGIWIYECGYGRKASARDGKLGIIGGGNANECQEMDEVTKQVQEEKRRKPRIKP